VLPDPSTPSWQELVTRLQAYPGIADPLLRQEFTPEVQALWVELDGRVQAVAQRIVVHWSLTPADKREVVEKVLAGLLSHHRSTRRRTQDVRYVDVRSRMQREAHRKVQEKLRSIPKWQHLTVPLGVALDGPIDEARRARLEHLFDQLPNQDRLLLRLAVSTNKPTVASMAHETGLKFSAVAVRRWRLWLRTRAILNAP
jgi:hypothetical protein